MYTKVVLLTGNELRHEFFRKYISSDPDINVLNSYCESEKGNLTEIVRSEAKNNIRLRHLEVRQQTESDFFGLFCNKIKDNSNPIFIAKGEINESILVDKICELNPDLIISYGCSIIKSNLLQVFHRRFINIHLGLSPYYRGSGTNFWPFVNKEIQCIGTTFMHIDSGVDTGEIIHQIRADIHYNDNIHQIGNRLIKSSFEVCIKIIKNFNKLQTMPGIEFNKNDERYYRKKDFTENALKEAYQNIDEKLIENYLEQKDFFDNKYPIISNSYFKSQII